MELGATVCTPKIPKCGSCPLRPHCRAHAHDPSGVTSYPAVPPKKVVPEYDVAVCCVRRGRDDYLMTQRPKKGLLAGQWEFVAVNLGARPSKEKALIPTYKQRKRAVDDRLSAECIDVASAESRRDVGVFTHKFTHQHHRMFVEEMIFQRGITILLILLRGGGCLLLIWTRVA